MAVNVADLRNAYQVLDANAAFLDRQTYDLSVDTVEVNAAQLRADLSAAAGGWSRADFLGTRESVSLHNPFLRAASGIMPAGIIETTRTSEALLRGFSASAESSFLKAMAQIASPTTPTWGKASLTGLGQDTSVMKEIAEGFRGLGLPHEQARSWPHIYQESFRHAGFQQGATMKQAFSNQCVTNAFGFQRHLDTPSLGFGTGTAQGFLRAYESSANAMLGAFNSPLLAEIGKVAVGFASVTQRFGEWIERWSRPLARASEWLRREMEQWPRDPNGDLVPFWNVRLYRLAQQAYEASCGVSDQEGYMACALFLDEIGADKNSADNILSIKELLGPTFGSQEPGHRRRPDRRKDWWNEDPAEARRWLKKRLRERNAEGQEVEHRRNGDLSYVEGEYREDGELRHEQERHIVKASFSEVLDFVVRESARQELGQILPERQYQTLMLMLKQYKYKEIAEVLGICPDTVKVHALKLRNNPSLLEQPELLRTLLA